MRIAICENNKIMLDMVHEKVLQYPFQEDVKVHKYCDGRSLKNYVIDHIDDPYDIILMDLCLTDGDDGEEYPDGIEVVKMVKSITPASLAIYMSSYSGFYTNLAQAEPFAFLHKPIQTDELFRVFNDCQKRLDRLKYKYFTYVFGKKEVKIDLNGVVYFFSRHRTIHYRLKNGTEEYFYGKLDDLESELEKMGAFFIRVNKSYIVNKIYVRQALLDYLIIDGQTINVTDKYKEDYRLYMLRDRFF